MFTVRVNYHHSNKRRIAYLCERYKKFSPAIFFGFFSESLIKIMAKIRTSAGQLQAYILLPAGVQLIFQCGHVIGFSAKANMVLYGLFEVDKFCILRQLVPGTDNKKMVNNFPQ
jgi:hypothetical protein